MQSLFTCLDLARLWQVPGGVVDGAAAGEGEVCRQPEGKAVVRAAAAVGGTGKPTTMGFMEV